MSTSQNTGNASLKEWGQRGIAPNNLVTSRTTKFIRDLPNFKRDDQGFPLPSTTLSNVAPRVPPAKRVNPLHRRPNNQVATMTDSSITAAPQILSTSHNTSNSYTPSSSSLTHSLGASPAHALVPAKPYPPMLPALPVTAALSTPHALTTSPQHTAPLLHAVSPHAASTTVRDREFTAAQTFLESTAAVAARQTRQRRLYDDQVSDVVLYSRLEQEIQMEVSKMRQEHKMVGFVSQKDDKDGEYSAQNRNQGNTTVNPELSPLFSSSRMSADMPSLFAPSPPPFALSSAPTALGHPPRSRSPTTHTAQSQPTRTARSVTPPETLRIVVKGGDGHHVITHREQRRSAQRSRDAAHASHADDSASSRVSGHDADAMHDVDLHSSSSPRKNHGAVRDSGFLEFHRSHAPDLGLKIHPETEDDLAPLAHCEYSQDNPALETIASASAASGSFSAAPDSAPAAGNPTSSLPQSVTANPSTNAPASASAPAQSPHRRQGSDNGQTTTKSPQRGNDSPSRSPHARGSRSPARRGSRVGDIISEMIDASLEHGSVEASRSVAALRRSSSSKADDASAQASVRKLSPTHSLAPHTRKSQDKDLPSPKKSKGPKFRTSAKNDIQMTTDVFGKKSSPGKNSESDPSENQPPQNPESAAFPMHPSFARSRVPALDPLLMPTLLTSALPMEVVNELIAPSREEYAKRELLAQRARDRERERDERGREKEERHREKDEKHREKGDKEKDKDKDRHKSHDSDRSSGHTKNDDHSRPSESKALRTPRYAHAMATPRVKTNSRPNSSSEPIRTPHSTTSHSTATHSMASPDVKTPRSRARALLESISSTTEEEKREARLREKAREMERDRILEREKLIRLRRDVVRQYTDIGSLGSSTGVVVPDEATQGLKVSFRSEDAEAEHKRLKMRLEAYVDPESAARLQQEERRAQEMEAERVKELETLESKENAVSEDAPKKSFQEQVKGVHSKSQEMRLHLEKFPKPQFSEEEHTSDPRSNIYYYRKEGHHLAKINQDSNSQIDVRLHRDLGISLGLVTSQKRLVNRLLDVEKALDRARGVTKPKVSISPSPSRGTMDTSDSPSIPLSESRGRENRHTRSNPTLFSDASAARLALPPESPIETSVSKLSRDRGSHGSLRNLHGASDRYLSRDKSGKTLTHDGSHSFADNVVPRTSSPARPKRHDNLYRKQQQVKHLISYDSLHEDLIKAENAQATHTVFEELDTGDGAQPEENAEDLSGYGDVNALDVFTSGTPVDVHAGSVAVASHPGLQRDTDSPEREHDGKSLSLPQSSSRSLILNNEATLSVPENDDKNGKKGNLSSPRRLRFLDVSPAVSPSNGSPDDSFQDGRRKKKNPGYNNLFSVKTSQVTSEALSMTISGPALSFKSTPLHQVYDMHRNRDNVGEFATSSGNEKHYMRGVGRWRQMQANNGDSEGKVDEQGNAQPDANSPETTNTKKHLSPAKLPPSKILVIQSGKHKLEIPLVKKFSENSLQESLEKISELRLPPIAAILARPTPPPCLRPAQTRPSTSAAFAYPSSLQTAASSPAPVAAVPDSELQMLMRVAKAQSAREWDEREKALNIKFRNEERQRLRSASGKVRPQSRSTGSAGGMRGQGISGTGARGGSGDSTIRRVSTQTRTAIVSDKDKDDDFATYIPQITHHVPALSPEEREYYLAKVQERRKEEKEARQRRHVMTAMSRLLAAAAEGNAHEHNTIAANMKKKHTKGKRSYSSTYKSSGASTSSTSKKLAALLPQQSGSAAPYTSSKFVYTNPLIEKPMQDVPYMHEEVLHVLVNASTDIRQGLKSSHSGAMSMRESKAQEQQMTNNRKNQQFPFQNSQTKLLESHSEKLSPTVATASDPSAAISSAIATVSARLDGDNNNNSGSSSPQASTNSNGSAASQAQEAPKTLLKSSSTALLQQISQSSQSKSQLLLAKDGSLSSIDSLIPADHTTSQSKKSISISKTDAYSGKSAPVKRISRNFPKLLRRKLHTYEVLSSFVGAAYEALQRQKEHNQEQWRNWAATPMPTLQDVAHDAKGSQSPTQDNITQIFGTPESYYIGNATPADRRVDVSSPSAVAATPAKSTKSAARASADPSAHGLIIEEGKQKEAEEYIPFSSFPTSYSPSSLDKYKKSISTASKYPAGSAPNPHLLASQLRLCKSHPLMRELLVAVLPRVLDPATSLHALSHDQTYQWALERADQWFKRRNSKLHQAFIAKSREVHMLSWREWRNMNVYLDKTQHHIQDTMQEVVKRNEQDVQTQGLNIRRDIATGVSGFVGLSRFQSAVLRVIGINRAERAKAKIDAKFLHRRKLKPVKEEDLANPTSSPEKGPNPVPLSHPVMTKTSSSTSIAGDSATLSPNASASASGFDFLSAIPALQPVKETLSTTRSAALSTTGSPRPLSTAHHRASLGTGATVSAGAGFSADAVEVSLDEVSFPRTQTHTQSATAQLDDSLHASPVKSVLTIPGAGSVESPRIHSSTSGAASPRPPSYAEDGSRARDSAVKGETPVKGLTIDA